MVKRGANATKSIDSPCCQCKKSEDDEFGWISCEICEQRFHGSCLNVDLKRFQNMQKKRKFYICQLCISRSNIIDETKDAITDAISQAINSAKSPSSTLPLEDDNDINKLADAIMQKLWPLMSSVVEVAVEDAVSKRLQLLEPCTKQCDLLNDRIISLENNLKIADKRWKMNNLIIQGVPNEISLHDGGIVKNLATLIKVNNFNLNDVEYCFRTRTPTTNAGTNHKSPQRPPTIIIRFWRFQTKLDFLTAYLKFIKSSNVKLNCLDQNYPAWNIYINEHLDQHTNQIFYSARQLKKDNLIAKVGIRQGTVFIRINPNDDIKIIKSIEHLDRVRMIINNATSTPLRSNQPGEEDC